MPSLGSDRAHQNVRSISTLGPSETDSAYEARKHASNVILFASFREAIDHAESAGGHALIPTGYLDVQDGKLTDAWVDTHFRLLGRMHIVDLWESPTKPMCLAINPQRVTDRASIRSVALHPATAVFARQACADATMTFFNSKPMAVEAAASGAFDACIGSLDMVMKTALVPVEHFQPTMVWTLYRSIKPQETAALCPDSAFRDQDRKGISINDRIS